MGQATKSLAAATPADLKQRRLDRVIEAQLDAAEAIILKLDELDGDSDAEPSLGSLNWYGFSHASGVDQSAWAQDVNDDREIACEDEGADEIAFEVL